MGENVTLSTYVGGAYTTKSPVLYSETNSLVHGGVKFDVPIGEQTTFYQDVSVKAGKDAFQGGYRAGVAYKFDNGTEVNAGASFYNDFSAPEFTILKDPAKNYNCPAHSGLLKVGVEAGIKHPINKNVELFANGNLSNMSYSRTDECVNPFKSKDFKNGKLVSYELKDDYRYEEGVKSIGASIEGGATVKLGNLHFTGKAGYSNWQGANVGISAAYNFNLLKFKLK